VLQEVHVKAALLITGSGPLLILTSHETLTHPRLLEKLRAKGVDKFIAYEVPLHQARELYAGHYDVVVQNLRESDDLRVLDFNGERIFRLFRLKHLVQTEIYEPD
jgi:hypothetical protein